MSEFSDKAAPARATALVLSIKDLGILHAAYMPFAKNGGIFVPTTKPYRLGDDVYLLISLMNDPNRVPVVGTVAWVTPPGAQMNKLQGMGVQFKAGDEGGRQIRARIETLLGGHGNSARPTHTL
ncbi:MAG: PilZ domain-containing protein [Betaproteobacteria bacterium]|nr:pilus assembly protein PilZ [Rhodocyclaceae bacterium]MCA3134964.1 pilus assembly protein PilZ [Rhodocyclaceae bacterium]MCA3143773.1 pilus assembly protein PilZ [Rhodocyclaceae bacterium]MCA3147074.1 pilus assembly protein PilZ [Rhodocyclaceae bacterium]MCE2898039.1 pilus assembly protein PilZ [Betaproteobacteria bacterium]